MRACLSKPCAMPSCDFVSKTLRLNMRLATARLFAFVPKQTRLSSRVEVRSTMATLHFDADGIEIFVGLPDDTVELLTATS